MMRREVFDEVGPFEPYPLGTQDTEFYTRAVSRARFANLPERLYLYRQHGNNISRKDVSARIDVAHTIRRRWLQRIGAEAPPAFMDRLDWLRMGIKLGWRERRLLRRDLTRLLDAMVAANALVASDLP
jgi:hypothetical protein